ncbi:MAG: endonuclease/exonuclease/phosphatase family protein [Myxococcota bacterium]
MTILRIMTWNVRYFGHYMRGVRSTDANLRACAVAIAQIAPPDVIALQEVEDRSLRAGMSSRSQLDRFAHALARALPDRRYQARYFPAHRYAIGDLPPLYTTGLAILVDQRFPILSQAYQEITHVRLPMFAAVKQRRIGGHVRVQVGRDALDVFNTHLSLPAFFEGGLHTMVKRMGQASNQIREAEALLGFVAERRQPGGPVVVMGDLNSRPGSAVMQAFADAGLEDAHRGQSARGTARFGRIRMHIDHIFSEGVQWEQAETMAVDDLRSPFTGLSDHGPKLGVLRLSSAS